MSSNQQPIADMTDSLLGWASKVELELAQQLAQVDSVADLNFSSDSLERIERFYGLFLSRQLAAGASLKNLVDITRALATFTMTTRAGRLTDFSNFAAEYAGGLGLQVSEDELIEVITQTAAAAKEAYGFALPDAQAAGETLGLIPEIAFFPVQAGLINSCVPTLLELIDGISLDANVLAEDVAAQIAQTQTPQYFAFTLDQNPELAKKIIEGVLAIRAFSLKHPTSWFDRNRSFLTPQLPSALAEGVAAELRERPVGTVDRESAVGVANRELRPRLILDSKRKKICLRLPEQRVPKLSDGQLGEVTWRVSIDATTKVYRTGVAWGDTSGYAEKLDITLDHAVRELTVQDVTNGITWTVPVVMNDEALVIFTAGGSNVTDKVSLHHQTINVLVPRDARIEDTVAGVQLLPLASFAVEGWDGWICHTLDVSNAVSLAAIAPGEQVSIEDVRAIDPRQRVMFKDPAEPIEHLRSLSGLPVFNESLLAEFPPTPSGQTETWYLAISSFGGVASQGEEITQPEPLEVPKEGGVFQVFDPELYDAPWVGEYLVRMRGPRNESFRHEFSIVEGASAVIDIAGACRSFRIPTGGGLSEATLTLKPTTKDFHTDKKSVTVGAQESGADIVVLTDEGDQLPIRFTPPRLTFELPLNTEPPVWRASRMVVRSRTIDGAGTLRIRAAGELIDPRVSLRNNHGAPVKTNKLTVDVDGITYLAPMSGIATSAATMPQGRIDLEWTDPRTDKRISVALADIRSHINVSVALVPDEVEQPEEDEEATPAPKIKPVGKKLAVSFANALGQSVTETVGDVDAWIWPLSAPWQPATKVAVEDRTIELPEEFVGAGDLAIQLHTPDSFMTLRAPVAPGESAFVIPQRGFFAEQDDALAGLSAFIAGESEDIPADDSIMPLLWDLLVTGSVHPSAASALFKVFRANPDAALNSLSNSLVPSDKQPGRIVASALARCEFTGRAKSDLEGDEHREDYHRAAWIGALELMSDIDRLYTEASESTDDAATPAEELAAAVVTPRKAKAVRRTPMSMAEAIESEETIPQESSNLVEELLGELSTLAGDNLLAILRTGRDETLDSACIDRSTVALASMEETQQRQVLDMLFGQGNIVPGAILDDGSRLLAVFETFTQREKLKQLLTSTSLIQPAVTLLRTLRSTNRTLYAMARVRFDKLDGVDTDAKDNVWSLTPVVSLILALAARMHAHGMITSTKTLDSVTAGWAKLADIVPDLVTSDLVAAEAMVLSVKHQGIV